MSALNRSLLSLSHTLNCISEHCVFVVAAVALNVTQQSYSRSPTLNSVLCSCNCLRSPTLYCSSLNSVVVVAAIAVKLRSQF